MYIPEFSIPLNREDLCKVTEDGQYCVKYLFSVKELQERLEEARIALSEEGPPFIVDHFQTFYSVFQHFKQTTELNRQKAWSIVSKSLVELIGKLNLVLGDIKNIEPEVKNDMRNITKMICYVMIELMVLFQDKSIDQINILLDAKSKKKQRPAETGNNWIEDKLKMLNQIYSLLQLPIKKLWDPPVVDEEFVNLIANFCYKCLEDPNISNMNLKWVRETIFQIFGTLIKNYLHGLSFCVKAVQLLKTNEHVVTPLAKGTVLLVRECKCINIVKEIVREITEADDDQLAADTSGTRSLNQFLVQLAEAIPETIIPAVDLLVNHLAGDSYTMRMCVLEILGEIILTTLSKENLDEELKKMRDEYLDCLEDHIHDVNAFVRSKVLQIWQKLCLENSIPILRLNHLLELTIGRLNDKSTNVKKQAIHLIKDLLERNPYSAQLNMVEIRNQIREEEGKIKQLEKTYNVNIRDADSEWMKIEPKLKELIEKYEEIRDTDESITERDEINLEEKIDEIGEFLFSGKLSSAVEKLYNLREKCNSVFNFEDDDVDLIVLLKRLYQQKVKAILVNLPLEAQDKLDKYRLTMEYLENALKFADLIDLALPIILTSLESNIISDVLESVRFFTAAYLFGFRQALEGVRKMLYLMYSKEDGIRSAVSNAYQNIYFDKKVQGRHHSVSTIKNLCDLILNLNESQLNALELVVKKWLEDGLIDKQCIQVMFERFAKKISNTDDSHSWAALVLIRMVGSQEPEIIRSNISVLLSQGLSNWDSQNFLTAKEMCRVLGKLMPVKEHGKPVNQTLRYPINHEIFIVLHKFLRDSIWRTYDPYYIPMAEEGVNLVFELCDKPDEFCERLVIELHERIVGDMNPLKRKEERSGKTLKQNSEFDEHLEECHPKPVKEEKTEEEIYQQDAMLLARFISILGQIAANYVLFLEGPVLNELKRRNQVDFERKMKKFQEKKSKTLKGRKVLETSANDRLNKSEQESGTEDLDFNRVAADDMDAEEMKTKIEAEMVTGNGYFAKFVPLMLTICRNPGKYNSTCLQNAAILTLSKFMLVSSTFCEENLQLLVTICEKSNCPLRRKNAIIALGALQYRFPNTLEPWTPHMYGVLKDPDPVVRLSSVMILTDLIVNEMIKVRSNISDLALCIVDKDKTIATTVRYFFREYSFKGNSLFNVLPCLISNLIRPDSDLTEEEFRTIMRFILGLFTKDKQSEHLIEKLFQYFESATTERQWKDLAFCLSLLNYNEKGLKKILENLRYFGSKLYLPDVYEAFCVIVTNASKNPQKDKSLLKEVQDLIKECRDKSCRDKNVSLFVAKMSVGKRNNPGRKVSTDERDVRVRRQLMKVKKEIKEEVKDNDLESDDGDNDAFMARSPIKKSGKMVLGKAAIKENLFSDDDAFDSDECPKKRLKKVKSRTQAKKLKPKDKYCDETSEEDEKCERIMRSNRKRK